MKVLVHLQNPSIVLIWMLLRIRKPQQMLESRADRTKKHHRGEHDESKLFLMRCTYEF